MATDPRQVVQRGHAFAIVDEVDSILIDEARTPLIISGPAQRQASGEYVAQKPRVERVFREQTKICTQLLTEAKALLAEAGLADEFYIFTAPKLIGGKTAPGAIGGTGFQLIFLNAATKAMGIYVAI